jgi:hypothetical protein
LFPNASSCRPTGWAGYLDEGFTPDYKLRKYQGEEGKELWYRETAENAFGWWLKNKERYANRASSVVIYLETCALNGKSEK